MIEDKKKKWYTLLALMILISGLFIFVNVTAESIYEITLSAEPKSEYVRGEKLDIPAAFLSIGADTYTMQHKLIFPDGDTMRGDSAILTDSGEYTLLYTYTLNDTDYNKGYKFLVKNGMSSLFTATENVEIQNNAEIPDYIDETEFLGSNNTGVKFTINSGSSASIFYNNVINLSELNFSKYNAQNNENYFLEWLATPDSNDTKEFSKFQVVLTDVYNAENYLVIDILAGDTQSIYPGSVYIKAAPCGLYTPMGWQIGSEVYSKVGTALRTSFYAKSGTIQPSTGKLFFDNENVELWGSPALIANKYINYGIMSDFDNPEVVGLNNIWNGFTTGEVYMTVNVSSLQLSKASFMIFNVGGKTANYDYQSNNGISINIEYGDYDYDSQSYIVAGEGHYFDVFKAQAFSDNIGLIEGLNTEVFYGKDKSTPMPVKNGRFNVENAGTYYIVYSLNSQYGYAYKEIRLTAKDSYEEADNLGYIINPEILTCANYGDTIYIYDGLVEGGIGKSNVEYTVSCISGDSQTDIEINKSGLIPYFITDRIGSYVINFIVKDSIGGVFTESMNIDVSADEKPFIKLPVLPKAYINGRKYVLPKAEAGFYSASGISEVNVYTLVNGTDYTNDEYTVSGDFTITYRAELKNNSEVYTTEDVNIKSVNVGSALNYIKSFFVADNCSLSGSLDGLVVTADNNNSSVSFINKVSAQSLFLNLNAVYENSNYESIDCYITDSYDIKKRIKISIKNVIINDNSYASFYINDKFMSFMAGSFDGTSTDMFTINYNNDTNSFTDAKNTAIGTAFYYLNGQSFSGFSSGYVYIDFQLEGVEAQSQFRIYTIANQNFSSDIVYDSVAPLIIYSQNLPTRSIENINSVFDIPSAIAFDCLSNIASLKVIVTDAEGNEVYNGGIDSVKSINLTSIGRYVIKYIVMDTANNSFSKNFYVFVQEDEPPVIELKAGYVTTASIGTNYTIAEAQVSDNMSEEVELIIYMVSPDYAQIQIKGQSVVFKKAGTYKIYYYAVDDYNNFALTFYEVVVK